MTALEDSRLPSLLQEAAKINADSGIKPFLADRIMRRVRSIHSREEQFFQAIWLVFKPVILASALFILGVLSYNALVSRNYEIRPTTTEMVFGLQPLTLTTAYSADLDELSSTIP